MRALSTFPISGEAETDPELGTSGWQSQRGFIRLGGGVERAVFYVCTCRLVPVRESLQAVRGRADCLILVRSWPAVVSSRGPQT